MNDSIVNHHNALNAIAKNDMKNATKKTTKKHDVQKNRYVNVTMISRAFKRDAKNTRNKLRDKHSIFASSHDDNKRRHDRVAIDEIDASQHELFYIDAFVHDVLHIHNMSHDEIVATIIEFIESINATSKIEHAK